MKFIRLTNTTEFHKDNFPATFLGNIEDVNIIVGSNNTRKSRFLRAIINQEHNVLIDEPDDFNIAYHGSQLLFDELESKEKKGVIDDLPFQFQFLHAASCFYIMSENKCISMSI